MFNGAFERVNGIWRIGDQYVKFPIILSAGPNKFTSKYL